MNKEKIIAEFISANGNIKPTISGDFYDKGLGSQYTVGDAIGELIDNSIDARIENSTPIVIKKNDLNHKFIFHDFCKGISNPETLFNLGETTKDEDCESIGKYGIGLKGATAAIARECCFDRNLPVTISINSANGLKKFSMNIAYVYDKDCDSFIFVCGEPKYVDANKDEHFTEIVFDNVNFNLSCSTDGTTIWQGELVDFIRKTYAETFASFKNKIGLDITLFDNGVRIPQNFVVKTFSDSSLMESVLVGKFKCGIRHTYFRSDERETHSSDDSSLRIYDANTGRLLSQDRKYWQNFAGREIHTNINGLHCGIFIDSSKECYRMFGVKMTKNGIGRKKYHKKSGFENLKKALNDIATDAVRRNEAEHILAGNPCEISNLIHVENTKYTIDVLSNDNIVENCIPMDEVKRVTQHGLYTTKGHKCFIFEKYFKDKHVIGAVKHLLQKNIKSA